MLSSLNHRYCRRSQSIMSIIPSKSYQSSVSSISNSHAASNAAPALPDALRHQDGGSAPLSSQLNGKHPLEKSIQNWDQTQRERNMQQYKQVFGVAEPLRREMELQIVQNSDFNPLSSLTNGSSIHRDILLNKEASVDWEDIYPGTGLTGGVNLGADVHGSIEKQLGL